jgi:ribosomal protein S18 acetylase RimI-like enzyme
VGDAGAAIRRLDANDVDEAGDLLARAFFDYPMLTWLMPDDAHRRRALPIFMRASVRWGLAMNDAFGIGDPLRGVAIWAPPGMSDLDLDPEDSMVRYHEAAAAMGTEAEARFDRFAAEQRAVRKREMGRRTWYLAWLGVDPDQQRTGAGAALLTDMFFHLDRIGDAVYLETESAANVGYYLRHGFSLVTEGVISGGGPPFWSMRRR